MMIVRPHRDEDDDTGFFGFTVGNKLPLAVIAVWTVGAIIWGVTLDARVAQIEKHGSPQFDMLNARVSVLEQSVAQEQRDLARLYEMSQRISAIDSRITRVEIRQDAVLESVKNTSAKIDKLLDDLNKHERETNKYREQQK